MRILELSERTSDQSAPPASIRLSVVYTGRAATRVALRGAVGLTAGLDTRVRVIVLLTAEGAHAGPFLHSGSRPVHIRLLGPH